MRIGKTLEIIIFPTSNYLLLFLTDRSTDNSHPFYKVRGGVQEVLLSSIPEGGPSLINIESEFVCVTW